MSTKEFCESGKHVYKEIDVVRSIFVASYDGVPQLNEVSIVVACSKCDSRFLRLVSKPIP